MDKIVQPKIGIDLIFVGDRKRGVDTEKVKELAKSIEQLGLLQPIVLSKIQAPNCLRRLVSGLHRLEACKLLGYNQIPFVELDNSDGLFQELAEIDENIVRVDLTEEQFNEQLFRRKEIYEMLYPTSTKAAKAKQNLSKTKKSTAQGDESKRISPAVPSFVADTSAKTGESERTIREKLHFATAINNMTPEVKKAAKVCGLKYSDKKKIAILTPKKQIAVLKQIKTGKASNVAEALKIVDKAKTKTKVSSSKVEGVRYMYNDEFYDKDYALIQAKIHHDENGGLVITFGAEAETDFINYFKNHGWKFDNKFTKRSV